MNGSRSSDWASTLTLVVISTAWATPAFATPPKLPNGQFLYQVGAPATYNNQLYRAYPARGAFKGAPVGPLAIAPPPKCTLTTPANPIVVTESAEVGPAPTFTVTLHVPASSGIVGSGQLVGQEWAVPVDVPPDSHDPWTGIPDICSGPGSPNPFTVKFVTNAPAVVAGYGALAPGSTATYAFTLASGGMNFTATLVGPGGTVSCGLSISAQCAPVQTEDIGYWDDPSGAYTDFSSFLINNDPPNCTFSACQFDGLGDPIPGCCGNRGPHPGCFAPETQIRLANGQTKRASDILSGDELWNPERERAVPVKQVILGPEKHPLIELGFGTTLVRVTTKHPMQTEAGLKPASFVTLSDSLLGADGKYHPVSHLRQLPVKAHQTVYNFELKTSSKDAADHMLVADGIVTGDYFLQELLEKRFLH